MIVEHCLFQACNGLANYVGYDRNLGLCRCKVDDLEVTCDLECRRRQKNRVTMHCPDTLPPFIRVLDTDDTIKVRLVFYLFSSFVGG